MAAKRLNQLIAMDKGVKNTTEKVLTSAYQNLQKLALLTGLSKTYRSRNEEGDKLPPESMKVQLRVNEVIADVRKAKVELFDTVGAKDLTNCNAKADIVVDGVTLASAVPATHLLWLQKQLVDLQTFIGKLPTLDPTEEWKFDTNQNCFATSPVETVRTKKLESVEVVQGTLTKEHPAQLQKLVKDIIEGTWTTTKFSGAMPVQEQKLMLERVEKLLRAVKVAHQEANMTTVSELNAGAALIGYVFGK